MTESQSTPPTPPDIEEQPLDRFPITAKVGRLTLGEIRTCPRCKGNRTKTVDKLGFFPDPDRTSGMKRCTRCNGWGIVPNVGP
jgi:hypothetical protein